MEGIFKKPIEQAVSRSQTRAPDLSGEVILINNDNTINVRAIDYTSGVAGIIKNVPINFSAGNTLAISIGDIVSLKWLGGAKTRMVVNGILQGNNVSTSTDTSSQVYPTTEPTDS